MTEEKVEEWISKNCKASGRAEFEDAPLSYEEGFGLEADPCKGSLPKVKVSYYDCGALGEFDTKNELERAVKNKLERGS